MYIYIYIYRCRETNVYRNIQSRGLGQNNYTLELEEVRFRWRVSVNVHWELPVTTHRKSDIPFEHTTDK